MQNVSEHLSSLADQTHALEHTVGQQLCHQALQNTSAITQLQSLDYLRQSLQDLAILTLTLSESGCCGHLYPKTTKDILQKLNLHDTKALVCATHASVACDLSDTNQSDIDIF